MFSIVLGKSGVGGWCGVMPITDPVKLRIVYNRIMNKKICRKCGAINPPNAIKCRRCKSKNLRPKRSFKVK